MLVSETSYYSEWHPTRNVLKATELSDGSGKKIWWQCCKNHEWEAPVYSRKAGAGCPFCAGRKILLGFNDLSTTYPEISKQWHPTKNIILTLETVTAGSGKKAWWQCEKGHEWEAVIKNRTLGQRGCPICTNKTVVKGINDFPTYYPELLNEWDYTKNNSANPHLLSPGSNEKVWWECEQNHKWEAKINARVNGTGCPYCSHNKINNTNNIFATEPEIAKFLSTDDNTSDMLEQLSSHSQTLVIWKCEKDHKWESSPEKINRNQICPVCVCVQAERRSLGSMIC